MKHLKQTKRHARQTKRHAGLQPKKSKRVIWFVVGAVIGTLLAILVFKPVFDKLNELDQAIIAPIKASAEETKTAPIFTPTPEASPVEKATTVIPIPAETTVKPVEPPKPKAEPAPETTPMAPPVDVVAPSATPIESEMSWVNATMKKYSVYANPITRFVFNHVPEGCNADACTLRESIQYEDGKEELVRVTIYFAPHSLTEYLLFHEIAHTKGIIDECAADAFAAEVLGTTAGSGFYDCPTEGK